jgi:alpha-tubulin suppressor-like RCC1 family protein
MMTTSILSICVKSRVKLMSCGFEHCMILTENGKVASWGCGASGALGHGNYLSYTEPNLIQTGDFASSDIQISYIECGGYHNGAIDKNGILFMWGRSDVGQLGHPKNQVSPDDSGFVVLSPKRLEYFQNTKV